MGHRAAYGHTHAMTMLLLTDCEHPELVIAARRRSRARLRARILSYSLDRSLAAGASPDTSAVLSLRAEQLIGTRTRRTLAKSLRGAVEQATQRPSPRLCSVPFCRRKILASQSSLFALARRLESYEPVDARGVARVRLLLTAGTGPLYSRPDEDDLEAAIQDALAALDVAP